MAAIRVGGFGSAAGGAAEGLEQGLALGTNIINQDRDLRLKEANQGVNVYLLGVKQVMENPATADSVNQLFAQHGMKPLDPAIVQAGQQGLQAVGDLTDFVMKDGKVAPDVGQRIASSPAAKAVLMGNQGLFKAVVDITKKNRMGATQDAFNADVAQHQAENPDVSQPESMAAVAKKNPAYTALYAGGEHPGLKQLVAPPEAVAQANAPKIGYILQLAGRGLISPDNAAAELAALGPAGEAAIASNPRIAEARAAGAARGHVVGTASGNLTPIPPVQSAGTMPPAGPMRAVPGVQGVGDLAPPPTFGSRPQPTGLSFGAPPRFVPEVGGADAQGQPLPLAGEVAERFARQPAGAVTLDSYVFEASNGKYKTLADAQAAGDAGAVARAHELQKQHAPKAENPKEQVVQTENGLQVVDLRAATSRPVTGQGGETVSKPATGLAAVVDKLKKMETDRGGTAPAQPTPAAAGVATPRPAPGRAPAPTPGETKMTVAKPTGDPGQTPYRRAAITEGQRLMRDYGLSKGDAIKALQQAGWNVTGQ